MPFPQAFTLQSLIRDAHCQHRQHHQQACNVIASQHPLVSAHRPARFWLPLRLTPVHGYGPADTRCPAQAGLSAIPQASTAAAAQANFTEVSALPQHLTHASKTAAAAKSAALQEPSDCGGCRNVAISQHAGRTSLGGLLAGLEVADEEGHEEACERDEAEAQCKVHNHLQAHM